MVLKRILVDEPTSAIDVIPPPSPSGALLPETVELMTLSVPPLLAMPPPAPLASVTLLPAIVLPTMLTVVLGRDETPPPTNPAELLDTVLSVKLSVPVPPTWMPPPC